MPERTCEAILDTQTMEKCGATVYGKTRYIANIIKLPPLCPEHGGPSG